MCSVVGLVSVVIGLFVIISESFNCAVRFNGNLVCTLVHQISLVIFDPGPISVYVSFAILSYDIYQS